MPLPSQKIRTRTVGQFIVSEAPGGEGSGGIAFFPYRMLFNDLAPDDTGNYVYPALVGTGGSYVRSDADFATHSYLPVIIPTELRAFPGSDSIYSSSSFGAGSGRSARLVAASLRVWYEGKEIDRGGSYITFKNPYVNGLPDAGKSENELMKLSSAAEKRVHENAVVVSYSPILETDTAVQFEPARTVADQSTVGGTPGKVTNRLGGLVLVRGATPGVAFKFEARAFFEVYGVGVPSTRSHTDVAGTAAVHEVVHSMPATATPDAHEVLKGVLQVAKGLAEAAFPEAAAVYHGAEKIYTAGGLSKYL